MATFREQLEILPSVAGIVITAMVLKDELLSDLTFESFTDAMAPKIKGNSVISLFYVPYVIVRIAMIWFGTPLAVLPPLKLAWWHKKTDPTILMLT